MLDGGVARRTLAPRPPNISFRLVVGGALCLTERSEWIRRFNMTSAEAGELRLEFRTAMGTIVGVQPIVVRPASFEASTM